MADLERIGVLRGIASSDEELLVNIVERLGGTLGFNDNVPSDSPSSNADITSENHEGVSHLDVDADLVFGYGPGDYIPNFDEILSVDDLILYQHFMEFRQKYAPDVAKPVAGLAFYNLIDTSEIRHLSDGRSVFIGPRIPFDGLDIKTVKTNFREPDTSISSYSQFRASRSDQLKSYAIVVGSLINVIPSIQLDDGKLKPSQRNYIYRVASKLASQVLV